MTHIDQNKATTAISSSHAALSLSEKLNEIQQFVTQLQQHVYLHCRLDTVTPGCLFCEQQQALTLKVKERTRA
jgi:hypothetical protein